MRVVSTLPAATETLFALGKTPAGVSHACDFPPAARSLPTVTATNLGSSTDVANVNQAMDAATQPGDIVTVERETLVAIDPDLVITQGVCEVCAVDDSTIERTLDDAGIDANQIRCHPHTLSDVIAEIRRIGSAIDRKNRAEWVAEALERRIDRVSGGIDEQQRSRCLVLDWPDPPMVAGHWVPELIRIAGGEPGLVSAGEHTGRVTVPAIRRFDPEVICVAPCGLPIDASQSATQDFLQGDVLSETRAGRTGRVWAFDGTHLMNRPGPRIVASLEVLAAVLQEDPKSPPRRLARSITPGRAVSDR